MFEFVVKVSKGNPGAMTCAMQLIEHPLGVLILEKVDKLKIYGTDLYVFWSDLCGKNFLTMANLCKNCPEDILKDACSRQDYSGRELVEKYL